jgi:hypothetical protein
MQERLQGNYTMLQINLNSKIINEAPTELPLCRRLLWRMGVEAFCEGRSYFDMLTRRTSARAGGMRWPPVPMPKPPTIWGE